MFQQIDPWTLLRNTAVWWSPVVAGFIGAFGVHLLTQSREREKWILDSKKAEFRELLSALSQAHSSTRSASAGFANRDDRTEYKAIIPIQDDSVRVFSDRLFVNNDLPLQELQRAWSKVMEYYSYTMDGWDIEARLNPVATLDKEYDRIKDAIVAAASRSVPKTAMQRLMFWKK